MQPPLFQHTVCALALLVVAMYFCWPTLFSGRSLVGGDIVQWRAAAQSMIEYRQETGEEPLWAANMFAGMPGYIVSPPALVPPNRRNPPCNSANIVAFFACDFHADGDLHICLVLNP